MGRKPKQLPLNTLPDEIGEIEKKSSKKKKKQSSEATKELVKDVKNNLKEINK